MSQNHLALETTIFFWLHRLVLFNVGKTTKGQEYKKVRIMWSTLETGYYILFFTNHETVLVGI